MTKNVRPIKTFLFDMGNVLIRFSHERMRDQMAATAGISIETTTEALTEGNFFAEYDRGGIEEDQVVQRFERWAGRPVDRAALLHAMSDIFSRVEEMTPLVKRLKEMGYRLVLLSNTNQLHFRFVRQHYPEVLAPFDAFVLSFEIGALKPEPAIFRAAVERIDCSPDECFYTDDIAEYIGAAQKHGFQAEVYTDADALRAQLAARDIHL